MIISALYSEMHHQQVRWLGGCLRAYINGRARNQAKAGWLKCFLNPHFAAFPIPAYSNSLIFSLVYRIKRRVEKLDMIKFRCRKV